MKTEQELLNEAYAVQDACNLSGVVHSFSRAISSLREISECTDTDYINQHLICVLYADKIVDLARARSSHRVSEAYEAAGH